MSAPEDFVGMDARLYVRQRLAALKPEFAWPPAEGVDLSDWGERLRARVQRLLGAVGEPFPDPSLRVLGDERIEGGQRQAVMFWSRPGVEAFGYLLLPDRPKGPGIVCLHGHGTGVDPNVGVAPEDYQHGFGLTSMRQGYTTLAIEQISFGRRRTAPVPENPDGSTCARDATAALMIGETMVGWRVRDAMAAVGVLARLPSVDPERIGTMGISGGGTTSFFTGVVDTRVAACVVSGYFNTFRDSILSIDHCVDNYVPGIGLVAEMPDLVAAIAPRRLFVESGTEDDIFPAPAFLGACDVARSIYEAWGSPDRFGSELFVGDHQFHGKGAFERLAEWWG